MRQVKENENCQETKKSKPGQAMIQMTGIKKEKSSCDRRIQWKGGKYAYMAINRQMETIKKSKMEMLAISTVNQKNQDPKQKTTHPHKSHQGTRE